MTFAAPRSLLVILAWIPVTLWVDTWASVPGQVLLGLITTALLVVLTLAKPVIVRWQVAIVVVFATVIELVFSGWLGVYEYRLGAVPAYVPAGHGLVYLAALDFGDWRWAQRHARAWVRFTVVVVVVVAVYALLGTRHDVLGAFWAVCLLWFLRVGRAPLLFVGAFWVVSWLEVLGTRWGVWTWQPYDTIVGWVPMGNPPSVAAGGYGWFDLVAVAGAGWLAAKVQPWFSSAKRRITKPDDVQPESQGAVGLERPGRAVGVAAPDDLAQGGDVHDVGDVGVLGDGQGGGQPSVVALDPLVRVGRLDAPDDT